MKIDSFYNGLNTPYKKKTIKEKLEEAAAKMKKYKVYNLVVEYKNNIVGVLSMHDILEANVL